MVEAHSLESIKTHLRKSFPPADAGLGNPPAATETSFDVMTPLDPERHPRRQSVTFSAQRRSKLVGLLFCHPQSPLAQTDIVPHLDYFHHRSGINVDFFCAGYGAHWSATEYPDQQPVGTVNGVPWLFSAKALDHIRGEMERESRWRYSGEAELLLMPAFRVAGADPLLDFDNAVVCNLEQMAADRAFTSARAFFERVFRFGESQDGGNPAWALSDSVGLEKGREALRDAILSLLPKPLQKLYRAAGHYVVQSIKK